MRTDKISDAIVNIRLTQEEKEIIRENAKKLGISISEYVRQCCVKIFEK